MPLAAAQTASGHGAARASWREQVRRVQRSPRAAARQQPPRDVVHALLLRGRRAPGDGAAARPGARTRARATASATLKQTIY